MAILSIRGVLDEAQYVWRRRGTPRGLMGLLLLSNFAVAPSMFGLAYFLLAKLGLLPDSDAFLHFVLAGGLVLSFLNILSFAIWLSARGVVPLPRGITPIFFAPQWGSDCEEIVLDLYESFREDLRERGLKRKIRPFLVSKRSLAFDPAAAHDFLVRRNGRVLIHGSIYKGAAGGKNIQGFDRINFTFLHRPIEGDEQALARDVGGALAHRAFALRTEDSFLDRRVVAENLSDVTRFLIGASLTLEGRFGEALELLRPLAAEVQKNLHVSPPRPHLGTFGKSVSSFLQSALHQQFTDIYEREVVDRITDPSCDESVARCEKVADEIARIPGGDGGALVEGIIAFHHGKIEDAKALIRKALRSIGSAHAAPHLSLAFLELWSHNYDEALRQYRRAEKAPHFDLITIRSVIRFLDSVVDRHQDRKELRFGLAFVNDVFSDRTRAAMEYQRFLNETEGLESMGSLRSEATARFARLSPDGGR